MPTPPSDLKSFHSLKSIVAALRGPDGCPWDKDQTHLSLTPFAIEEVFELVETIENQDDPAMREELGDVLFQVVLHSQLAEERKAFTLEEVIYELNKKMVRRHPHVFGEESANTKEEVLTQWEVIKKNEKKDSPSVPSKPFNIPQHLPSLQRAYKIGNKTNKVGFDWTKASEVKEKILEELHEIEEQLQQKEINQLHLEEEIGDLLFSVAQYARHLGHEPESCLRKANAKFEKRYASMLEISKTQGLDFASLDVDAKEVLWRQVKKQEKENK